MKTKKKKTKRQKPFDKKTEDTLNRLVLYYMTGIWK